LRWISVLTTQKRKYAMLQTRISWGFHRPTSTHLSRIGRVLRPTNIALPNATDRR
jgi:hypothetical protein